MCFFFITELQTLIREILAFYAAWLQWSTKHCLLHHLNCASLEAFLVHYLQFSVSWFDIEFRKQKRLGFSPNQPTGPIWSSSRDVRPFICCLAFVAWGGGGG